VKRSASTTFTSSSSNAHCAHERTCAATSLCSRGVSVPSRKRSNSGSHEEQRTRTSFRCVIFWVSGVILSLSKDVLPVEHLLRERDLAAMNQRLDVSERESERARDRVVLHIIVVTQR